VAVVIPNWNGAAHLRRCLAGLAAQTRPADEVVVVDNGSSDESATMVRAEFPTVRLIELPHNTGFAPAVNLGIRSVDCELVALLNNDAVPHPDWLSVLLSAEAAAPDEIGFLTSKIVTADGRFIDSAGDFLDDAGVAHQRGNGEPDTGQFDGTEDVFSACGCATMYRRTMLDDIDGFDDAFFAYYEDVDVCLRARLRGWRGLYVGAAAVQHAVSATSSTMSSFKLYHGVRNSWFVVVKGMPSALLPQVLPRFALVQAIWLLRAARAGQLSTVLHAYGSVGRALPRLLSQRRQIRSQSSIPADELRAQLVPSLMARRLAGVLRARLDRRMSSVVRIATAAEPLQALRTAGVIDNLPAHVRQGAVLDLGAGLVAASIDGPVVSVAASVDARPLLVADPSRLPLADGALGAAVVGSIDGDLSSMRSQVLELVRVVRPGGCFVICSEARATVGGVPVAALKALLQGFPVASVTVVRDLPTTAVALLPRARGRRIRAVVAVAAYLLRSVPPSSRRILVVRR
jgi:GT2 family glycosyltransferase